MNYEQDPLWQALESMRIEPEGAHLTFPAKLARENGWSMAYARAVDAEYRRFLYLAVKRGPASPSADVDRAWHLHLAYTRHYWDEMCGRLIGRPLHHEPSEGGAAATRRLHAQYAATLAHYRELFGASPPESIWPRSDCRFVARPLPFRRVRPALVVAAAGAALTASTAMAGSGAGPVTSAFWVVAQVLALTMILLVLVWLGILAVRSNRDRSDKRNDAGCGGGRDGGDSGCGGGCGGD